MRLSMVTFGSRGDIEPFVTLGKALVNVGHEVRLLTHPEYVSLAEGTGVEMVAARGRSTRELIESDEGREVLRHVRNPLAMLRRVADLLAPELHLVYEDMLRVAVDADAVLAFPATFPALDVADYLGRPVVHVHHVPAVPTRNFPAAAPYINVRTLTPLGNRASYTLDAWVLWRLTREAVTRARSAVLGPLSGAFTAQRALGQRRRRAGAIIGVSPHVLPPPRDWPRDVVACGYWWPASAPVKALDPSTEAFLAGGPPPVFFGLGSTPLADSAAAVTRDVITAARDAEVRLVLQRGWAGLGDGVDAPNVHVIGDMPYDAIFPRVAAVAHHGGAGTTALGLRHGRPTLCVPALADQFFWGHRIAESGAGPAPLPVKRLTRSRLAQRLAALVENQGYYSRASALAPALASEDGSSVAVAAIERFLTV